MKISGFTLIECLITLALFFFLFTFAVVPFASFVKKTATQSDAARLFHTLQFAKMEAIKRQKMVSVCPSQDNQHCSSHWGKTYLVLIENPHSSQSEVLQITNHSIYTTIHSQKVNVFKFSSDGRCLTRGSIYIQTREGPGQKIVLYDSGRIRMEEMSAT